MAVELLIPPDLSKLEDFRNRMGETLEKLVGQKEWSYEILLALEEILVNVIEHGFRGMDNPPPVKFLLKVEKSRLVIRICDKGTPYDLTHAQGIDLSEHYKAYKKRGLGIFLVQNIASRLDYQFSGEEGNILMLEKDL